MKRNMHPALVPIGYASLQQKSAASGADAKAIASIEKSGGLVIKIAQNDDREEVNFKLQGPAIKDENLAPLQDLSNLVHLDLGKTAITDAGLANLKGLTKLTELHLEETKITDKGIANLKDLKSLEYLNLYGTAITDAGLDQLKDLPNLKHLYVWQTKVTEGGVKKLKAALPKVEIVTGWEQKTEAKK
jgi:hypothetical protein